MPMTESWYWPILRRIDRWEIRFRAKIRRAVYSVPFVWRFKMIKTLTALSELYAVLSNHGIEAYVVGGFSYDGLRGKMTRGHADIDISILGEDLERTIEHLTQNGYRVQYCSPYKYRAWKNGIYGELFIWHKCEDGSLENLSENKGVRVPRDYFREGQTVCLDGVTFKIPSMELMRVGLVFMVQDEDGSSMHENDRRYVLSRANGPAEMPHAEPVQRQVSYTVAMHDFRESERRSNAA